MSRRSIPLVCLLVLARPAIAADWDQALARRVSLSFVETELGDVFEYFKSQTKLPIVVDYVALERLGIVADRKVTQATPEISLRSGLNLILEPLRLTTVQRDEVLLVTSIAEADAFQVREVYPIGDLLAGEQPLADSSSELVSVIQDAVAPTTWDAQGGRGSMRPLANVLVVAQSQYVHAQLAHVLAALRRSQAGKPNAKDPYAAIRKALDAKATIEFNETPLTDVLAFLSDQHKVPIVLDPEVAANVGAKPLTASLSNVSLRSVLTLLLAPNLTFELRHEVLLITRREWAESHLESQVHDIRDLLDDESSAGLKERDLLAAITGSVSPESWTAQGGRGNARVLGGLLVVYQTQHTQREVQQLLNQLRQKLKRGS